MNKFKICGTIILTFVCMSCHCGWLHKARPHKSSTLKLSKVVEIWSLSLRCNFFLSKRLLHIFIFVSRLLRPYYQLVSLLLIYIPRALFSVDMVIQVNTTITIAIILFFFVSWACIIICSHYVRTIIYNNSLELVYNFNTNHAHNFLIFTIDI